MEKRNVKEVLQQLTLEEKAALCSGAGFWNTKGVERLGIPPMMLTDGPNGLRKQQGDTGKLGIYDSLATTCFPAGCALATSFDRELLERVGQLLGEACQAENVGMLNGPSINIKRSPLCGRSFEYYSEDPALSGELGATMIQGIQSRGVAACAKHFAANNQETRRMSSNSVVDQRTLREIYLAPFETVVKKGKPRAVMAAYNQVNGTFCTQNRKLLTDILRDEWGFDGMVVSDWGAIKNCVKGIQAGLNLEMPSTSDYHAKVIVQAVQNGELEEEVLDRSVEKVLTMLLQWQSNRNPATVYDREEHYQYAVQTAKECTVLLKNDHNTLPLKKNTKVAFLGAFAEKPRNQAFGSSRIHSYKVKSALQAAEAYEVVYRPGYLLDSDEIDEKLLEEAVQAAMEAEAAVVFAGLPAYFETEGLDRKSLDLPKNHNALIKAVSKVNPNTIVVLHNGSVVDMPWEAQVPAILEMYLAGDGIGEATVSVLFGDCNPSGKLAETFPRKLSDNPSYLNFPGEGDEVKYKEGVFVGYRYYDKKNMDVLFPFGHGLSYTSFAYSNMKLDRQQLRDGETLTVTATITNTGDRAGKEAVQLYVRNHCGKVIRPVRELRDFAKVTLEPGESKTVNFTLGKRAFAYYNEQVNDFVVESGSYTIELGSSSRDIRCAGMVSYEAKPLPPVVASLETCMEDVLDRPTGKVLYQRLMDFYAVKDTDSAEKKESAKRDVHTMAIQYPISAMTMFSSLKEEELQQCIAQINQESAD